MKARNQAEWKVYINGVEHSESEIESLQITRGMVADGPKVGACVSGELTLSIKTPAETVPRMASIVPYVRAFDGVSMTEWKPLGVYYIDTRSETRAGAVRVTTYHAYDSMLKTEQDCPEMSNGKEKDIAVVNAIATLIGVEVDSSVTEAITNDYDISRSVRNGNTARQVLGFIGAAYGGSFFIGNNGELCFATLLLPAETNYLIDHQGNAITFGGDRILV